MPTQPSDRRRSATPTTLPQGSLTQTFKNGRHMGIRAGETVQIDLKWNSRARTTGPDAYDFTQLKVSFHTAKAEVGFAGGRATSEPVDFGTFSVNGRTLREGAKIAFKRDGTLTVKLKARALRRDERGIWGWLKWKAWLATESRPVGETPNFNVNVGGTGASAG